MVITGLTRNQFVPKAHEGSNPSLSANAKGVSGTLFALAEREGHSKSISKAVALEKVQNPVLIYRIIAIGRAFAPLCFYTVERGSLEVDLQSESYFFKT